MSGALDTSVTLEEVFAIVGAKRVPLAPELAGYLALEISEQADAAGGDIDPKFVFIGEEGTIGLVRPKRDAAAGNAEGSIRTILARLLEASGSQTPALGSASRRKATGGLPSLVEELEAALIPVNRAAGRRALARLAREVKRVTLGVGRNASNPAASDLPPRRGSMPSMSSVSMPPESPREAALPIRPPTPPTAFPAEEDHISLRAPPPEVLEERAPSTTPAPYHDASDLPTVEFSPQPRPHQDSVDNLIANFGVASKSDQQVGRELKAMIGLDPTPPPPGTGEAGDDVEALLAISDGSAIVRPKRASAASIPPEAPTKGAAAVAPPKRARAESKRDSKGDSGVRLPMRSYGDERQLPTGPSQLRSQLSMSDIRPKRGNSWLYALLAGLLVAGAIVVWRLKPGFLSGRTQDKIDAEKAQAAKDLDSQLKARQAAACKATLVVTDVPTHAEVLLRVGQAPVDVPRMPVGARLEFVATADGYAPKRAVVLAGASWDKGPDDKPRVDAPVQLEKSKAKLGQVDPWPPAEPGSAAGGDGPPGTVHVISNIKGAEVWLLAGLGPEATISELDCDASVDVLVAGPTTFRKRLRVAPADFASGDGSASGGPKSVRTARVSAQ